jgi:ABC-2 type transport system ATP-binding protein
MRFALIYSSMPPAILSIENLSKTYPGNRVALKGVTLEIHRGEIFALLGPNGAGKTTLIGIVCGLVNPTSGRVMADGFDVVRDFRNARRSIGLVPQELTTDAFETVLATVRFSRGLFGRGPDDAHIERVLRSLSLWDRRNAKIKELSGGMKRRVLIAKALSHEPRILFLDEPSAGVDVELRRDMWNVVRELRAAGVTIILTTHYIEEAEQMADRIGIINHGVLIVAEEKNRLMSELGSRQLTLHLSQPLAEVPAPLARFGLALGEGGSALVYHYQKEGGQERIADLLRAVNDTGVPFRDLETSESSLEEIFVSLVGARR